MHSAATVAEAFKQIGEAWDATVAGIASAVKQVSGMSLADRAVWLFQEHSDKEFLELNRRRNPLWEQEYARRFYLRTAMPPQYDRNLLKAVDAGS